MQGEDARFVRLAGVPTSLYVRLHAHVDDLLRELALLDVAEGYGLGPEWDRAREQAETAERAGREHVDLELRLPADAADRLGGLFEQADALARAGLLLTTEAPPELRELRDRLVAELSRRLQDGHSP
ncbi:MAG TPA: hypothetical protein VHF47_01895 [Acidimicrobiales bacterium]|nr:hypothetical protein [Acidimicrobiales bacterium]